MKNNHSQEEIDVIVNGWKVPSYNLVKELDSTRLKSNEYLDDEVIKTNGVS